jgi:hypothetical protein
MPVDVEIATARTSEHQLRSPLEAVRGNAFGVVVMLLIQYALGMWVNLYAHLPASDHGKGVFASLGNAVADGPVELGIHAVLGVALLVPAVALLVRAILARLPVILGASLLGLAAIIAAAINGDRFVATQNNGVSLGMALSAGFALLCYVIVMFSQSSKSPGT